MTIAHPEAERPRSPGRACLPVRVPVRVPVPAMEKPNSKLSNVN